MIAFQAASAAQSGNAASTTITWPGGPAGQLLVAVFGFEGVAAGSGPWVVDSSTSGGWQRLFAKAPSAAGCGLEVWQTFDWSSGLSTLFDFDTARNFVARGLVYTGQYDTGDGTNPIRAWTARDWTGDDPEAPSVYAFENEMLIAVAAEQMQSPGFGTPTPAGWTERIDSSRGGFGNVEITAADKPVTVEGESGVIPWSAAAATGASDGATGVFAIRPAATVTPLGATSPLIAVEFDAAN